MPPIPMGMRRRPPRLPWSICASHMKVIGLIPKKGWWPKNGGSFHAASMSAPMPIIPIPPEDPPMPQWPAPPEKKVTLLLPEQPYMPEASHVREDMGRRSGYFGYHGDPLLYTAHRQPLDL